MILFRLILLLIGTALSAFYIWLLLRGAKYDGKIEGLPDEGFSDKELFSAGYMLQELPALSMQSEIGQKLMSQAQILHPENEGRFAEYWARLYWARTLSLSLLVLAFTFCVASWMQGFMIGVALVFGIVAVYVVYSSGANEMNKQITQRSEECLLEFSNVVSKLAMLLNCNETIPDAWHTVAYSKEGVIYDLMREACAEMDSNVSLEEALYAFGVRTASPEIRKFTSILIQSATRGGSDVTVFMRQQVHDMGARHRQIMLQKGDEAAAKLLIPTMVMLVGILIIIIAAAVSGLNLNF